MFIESLYNETIKEYCYKKCWDIIKGDVVRAINLPLHLILGISVFLIIEIILYILISKKEIVYPQYKNKILGALLIGIGILSMLLALSIKFSMGLV